MNFEEFKNKFRCPKCNSFFGELMNKRFYAIVTCNCEESLAYISYDDSYNSIEFPIEEYVIVIYATNVACVYQGSNLTWIKEIPNWIFSPNVKEKIDILITFK